MIQQRGHCNKPEGQRARRCMYRALRAKEDRGGRWLGEKNKQKT